MIHLLSDDVLLSTTQKLVRQECETLAQILKHLKEIERRRLYGGSLFEYLTTVLARIFHES